MKSKTVVIPIAGMQHRATPSTRRMIQARVENVEPMPMRLEREADNEHDENAIKVMVASGPYKGFHLGYVPRGIAAQIAPKLDEGRMKLREAFMSVVNADDADADVVCTFDIGSPGTARKPKKPANKRISKKKKSGA